MYLRRRSLVLSTLCGIATGTRIYRTDQNDEADGLTGGAAVDGDNIVIRSNGTTLAVNALEGGQPFQVTSCQPSCT
jgi:hypothetical protein